jgi:hypothetical protein
MICGDGAFLLDAMILSRLRISGFPQPQTALGLDGG